MPDSLQACKEHFAGSFCMAGKNYDGHKLIQEILIVHKDIFTLCTAKQWETLFSLHLFRLTRSDWIKP